uniref:MalT-like TPR region domain-containing protein n=1 Tax=Oryza rufipogon TaxID=4529 RepID=A0A0E0PNH8_ORYRU
MNPIRSALARALLSPKPRPPRARHYATSSTGGATQPESVAAEMVRYALGGARPGSSPDEAMRILEQGASNLQGGGEGCGEAVGMLMLAMSTLLYRSGRRQEAMEKLKATNQVAPAAFRVAAWEATMGLCMEAGQVINTSVSPDDLVDLSIKDDNIKWSDQGHLKCRVNAIKGLIALLNGETESAQLFFDGCKDLCAGVGNKQTGMEVSETIWPFTFFPAIISYTIVMFLTENAVLSYCEYLHCVGDFPLATQMYERVLEALTMEDMSGNFLATCNMVPEEVSLGATCSYGQLLSHSGKFSEAEDYLTRALKKAEDQFGANHPKVGIVLTCVARMYKLKAKAEGSSSIMVQEVSKYLIPVLLALLSISRNYNGLVPLIFSFNDETIHGLYRKALEVLRAPAINSEGVSKQMDWRDIISLARGEYAELLLIQSNRRAEGERMKEWAEHAWRNSRLTLAQALEFSGPSKPTVVDTRIGRVM